MLLVSSSAAAQELPFTQFTPNDQVSPLPSASVQKIIQENASGQHDYNYLIYILLSFELWCRVYLDAVPKGAELERAL